MTLYTKTKINRLFEEKIIRNKDGDEVRRVTVRKENPESADPRFRRPCRRCGLPMMVSEGQTAHYHEGCRLLGRRAKKL